MKFLSIATTTLLILLEASSTSLAQNTENTNSNTRVCPVNEIYPNSACDVATQDELSCGYDYIWTGCDETKGLTCTPITECSCNDPYGVEGTWSCRVMSMMQFCEDGEASTPALRLTSCTPEVEVEQQEVEVDAADVELQQVEEADSSASSAQDAVLPSSTTTTAVPISFYGLNYNTRKGPDWAADSERCKSRQEVARDLTVLSRVTNKIRLLSLVDCNQGELVWSVLNDELSQSKSQSKLQSKSQSLEMNSGWDCGSSGPIRKSLRTSL